MVAKFGTDVSVALTAPDVRWRSRLAPSAPSVPSRQRNTSPYRLPPQQPVTLNAMVNRVDGGDDSGELAEFKQFTIDVYGAATEAALRELSVWSVPPRPDSVSPETAAVVVDVAQLVGAHLAGLVPPHLREEMAGLTPVMVADLRKRQ